MVYEAAVNKLLKRASVGACSIVVTRPDGVISSHYYGTAREASKYHLFSCTKLFTALAVLKLVETGGIQSLDDAASKYLPSSIATALGNEITIRHLLSHSSGLADKPISAFLSIHFVNEDRPSTLQALLKYAIKHTRKPGIKASYGNVNYALLGEIVARCSTMEFESFVKEHVLDPMGSKATFSMLDDTENAETGLINWWTRFALGFVMEKGHYEQALKNTARDAKTGLRTVRDFDLDSAAVGGLCGTAMDFVPMVQLAMNGGKPVLENEQLMKESFKPQAPGAVGIMSKVAVGLGWKYGKVGNQVDFFNHEGGGGGFTTELRIYPREQLGIVIMMNKWSLTMAECKLAHQICEIIRKDLIK